MARMIQLTKVSRASRSEPLTSQTAYSDTDDVGENAGVVPQAEPPQEEGSPVVVNVDAIRCFYERREGRPGTRITFVDGGGFAVSESLDTVRGLVSPN